jgi:hypothetical protein
MPMPEAEPPMMMAPSMPEIDEGEGLEAALLAVRTWLDIDDEVYTQFHYYQNFRHDPTGLGSQSWFFSWSDDDWTSSIDAAATVDGRLMFFNIWDSGAFRQLSFAELDLDEALELAKEFIANFYPEDEYTLQLPEAPAFTSVHSSNYDFSFFPMINGFRFDDYPIYVSLDKNTGEITNFSRPLVALDEYNFITADHYRSKGTAKEAFLEEGMIELYYTSHYDWITRELTVFPVYAIRDRSTFINAVTGRPINIGEGFSDMFFETGLGMALGFERVESEDSARAFRMPQLSHIEAAAVDAVGNLISRETAIQKVFDYLEIDVPLRVNARLFKDEINTDQYIYNIDYSEDDFWISARVDARDGTILSLTNRDLGARMMRGMPPVPGEDDERMSQEELNAVAIRHIEALSPYDLSEFRLSREDMDFSFYTLFYTRVVNGVEFRNNNISISINASTGELVSYSLTWFEDVAFEPLTDIIDAGAAFDVYDRYADYGIMYQYLSNPDDPTLVNLVYAFRSRNDRGFNFNFVDPFTGKMIGWGGREISLATGSASDYSDVAGHWSEDIVSILAANGVLQTWGGAFRPDETMTLSEFTDYVSQVMRNFIYFERTMGSQPNPIDVDKTITRQEAFKFVCEALGYDAIARRWEIFNYPFSGSVDEEYKGYVTIANALGMVRADSAQYDAKAYITRAEAAYIIYNFVLNS